MIDRVKSFTELPALLTVGDLQAALGIGRVKAYQLINSKGFPAVKIGRCVRIPKESLLRWLEQQQR